MLVLTRKSGESFRIGQDIEIVVLEVIGTRVRIGIKAPVSVPVVRTELARECPNCRELLHRCRCSLADARTEAELCHA